FVLLAGFGWGAATLETPQADREALPALAGRGARRAAVLLGLIVLGAPALWTALPAQYADLGDHLHGRGEAPAGFALVQRAYYQALTKGNDRTAVPWVTPPDYSHEWAVFGPQKDFLQREYPRSASLTFRGQTLTTNQWGFRGHDYSLAKPPGTWRVEIYGPSDLMGWGVGDREVFSTPLENMLDSAARAHGKRAEVLNFSVPGTSLAQEVALLQDRGLKFQPDLVLLSVHPYELWSLEETFHAVQMFKWTIPDTGLARLAGTAHSGDGCQGRGAGGADARPAWGFQPRHGAAGDQRVGTPRTRLHRDLGRQSPARISRLSPGLASESRRSPAPRALLVRLAASARRGSGGAAVGERQVTVLHQGFLDSVRVHSDRPAVKEPGTSALSYRQLGQLSDHLRNTLVEWGVKPGDRIGLCLPKSIDVVSLLLGVLKCGGAYVPIDYGSPAERAAYILKDCGVTAAFVARERLA